MPQSTRKDRDRFTTEVLIRAIRNPYLNQYEEDMVAEMKEIITLLYESYENDSDMPEALEEAWTDIHINQIY